MWRTRGRELKRRDRRSGNSRGMNRSNITIERIHDTENATLEKYVTRATLADATVMRIEAGTPKLRSRTGRYTNGMGTGEHTSEGEW